MALLEDGLIKVGTGVAVGIGAIILAPVIFPIVGAVVKPLLRAGIKGGIVLYQKASEMVAEAAETIEDLVEEAKAEVIGGQNPVASSSVSESEIK